MARTLLAILLLGTLSLARPAGESDQETLEYTGEPLAVPVRCGNDQIAELGLVCPTGSPCPVFLELTSATGADSKVFVTGNLHTDRMTIFSVLLASEDGGRSWSEPADRIVLAGLDTVSFYDDEHGWAVGHMLDGGRPRDPFFLLTTDGGRYWRKRAVFGDNRLAEVQHFSFESERSGVMLIDRLRVPESGSRYERYESMTGGESWMIREVSSSPIRLRRRILRAAQGEWTVEIGESGAWQVRKRTGDSSVVVAEFLVEPGACEMVEETLAEAPPEAETAPAGEVSSPQTEEPEPAATGVFVIGAPRQPTQPQQTTRETDDRPTIKKPKP